MKSNNPILIVAALAFVGYLLWKLNQQTRLKESYQDAWDRDHGY